MKYKIRMGIILGALIGCFFLIKALNQEIWDANYDLLRKEVLSIDQSVETVRLIDVTPFEWDIAYFFDPYTPAKEIYKTVGYEWDRISATVSEGMNQIVFLNNGEVVCYVYGYPSNNGFGIFYEGSSLKNDHDLNFRVSREKDVVTLNKE
ncbi:hypothetical protein LCL96_01785 [Rossellomorea aquimaris]|uniref:hypothetical protein n=1 Tax=Rossellomorea aquimaris TaxID=189382 RepID=UPI001CD5FAF7|nr:hypothetical protein [Rossellomorea aquimaris]MCA1057646.1 hypothetical protein [Rossellomorea aquimaris]